MTQEQYKWLQDNGYDPAVHDVDDQGNIFENPINQPQQKEVMSPLRAGLTSFAGNLLPSAAGLYAGAQTGALGGSMFGLPGTIIGGIGGGLLGGYGAGKLQEKALEEFAPGAAEEMARAQRDQPVASYAGGFLPNALALKPSFGGIKGLAAPLMSMERNAMRAAFTPAAVNVGANVAGSTAGQLVDMSQGGEFSVPRFAADVALGSVFSDPNKLGRKFGLQALKPDVAAPEQAMDLGALRTADTEARVAGETESARIMDETRGQMAAGGMTGREVEMFKTRPEMEWWKQPEATRIQDIQNVAKQVKQRLPKGMAEQLAGMPEIYDVVQNPEKFPAFLGSSLEEALNAAHERSVQDKFLSPEDLAMQEKSLARRSGRDLPTETPLSDVTEAYKTYRRNAKEREEVSRRFMGPEERADIARMDETKRKLATQKASPEYRGQQMGARREGAEAFTPEGGIRVAPESWTPKVVRPTRAAVTTEEILGRQSQAAKPVDEGISLEQALKPTPEEVAKADKIQADNARVEAEQNAAEIRKMQDLDAAQALSDEAAARLQGLQARQAELQKLAQRAPSVVRRGVREQGAPDIAQAKQELADARAIAEDLYSRLQRAGGEGLLNQADLDAATRLAAQRGLRVLPATTEQQAQGIRGAYVVNENGERVIYINPLAATADTAIHEIGHDVFKTSANERMRRSLMDTAMDSDAYKREYAARQAEVDKNGKRVNTDQQAQDIALEEGIIEAFGKNYPNVKPGEIRQWFNALKSSVKSMVGMKISPDDALAWMHYATTEAVPWKGVAVAKGDVGGEERMQRGSVDEQPFQDISSAGTSRPQIPAVFKSNTFISRGTNIDIGAGKYDLGKEYLESKRGVTESVPFDPFNRSVESNRMAVERLQSGERFGTATIPNTLNVIAETSARDNVILQAARAIEPEGVAYFQIWEGDKSGIGGKTTAGFQNNKKTADYVEEIRQHFTDVRKTENFIVASNPKVSERKAFWQLSSDAEGPSIRYQRGPVDEQAVNQMIGESVSDNIKPLVEAINLKYEDIINSTGMMPEMRSTLGNYIQQVVQENPSAFDYFRYKVGDKNLSNNVSYYNIGLNEAAVESLLTGKPIELSESASNNYKAMAQDVVKTMRELKVDNSKVNNIEQLLSVLVNRKIKNDPNIIQQNEIVKRWSDPAFRQQQNADYKRYNYQRATEELTQLEGQLLSTFDPSNPSIRYQRGLLSKIQTPSELDYLVTKGGPFAEVGTTIKASANTRDFKQGQWSSKYSLTNALPEEARVRLLNHLAGEFDSGVRSTPATELRPAYDQLRNEYLPAIVSDYNTAGFTVRDTAGQRARGSNPTYFPLHSIADEVNNILTTKQGSPEWDKLKGDFINWNTQLRQADGASLPEAQKYATEKFEEKLSITAKPPGIESGIPFSGARKPEGYPLPPSWRSDDIIDILNNYTRRSATDFAYQQHVESSPVAMAALGAKTMVNNQPIPANILQSTAPVINDPSVQSVLREYRGTPAQRTEGLLPSIGRFVTAATIGPVSKVGDIGTSMFKGLAYLQGSEYASGLADFTKRIGDWAALKERSYASGLNKRDAAENMRQVLGIAEDSTAFMDKAARVLSKGTFVNDLESAARVIAQGWGETIVGINKKLALTGDKNATQMLDTLTPDWRTRSDADLAAQVGRLLQGSYDMRQLPASVLEGAAAPYLTWSKWSIGQYDSFQKYALQPAMQGNMKPLIGQMLIGLMGGGAISAVQEWLNNREGKDITWKELESWMQQNQGELGADGGMMLGQKLLTMSQKMGTFGFAGDLTKMVIDASAGGSAQGVATMPAMDAIYDVSKRAAAAVKALDDGEDFGLVLKALMQDSLTGHVQALRVARNWLDEDENLRYDDRRRQRLFDKLTGLPSKGGTFSVNYSNLSERAFERGEITEKTGEEAFDLVSRARQEATSGEDYASRIRKLKTSQNAIMPSLERQPQKAARYLSFVEGAEPGRGGETLKRYYTRQNEDKYRKSLIEGMSGIR